MIISFQKSCLFKLLDLDHEMGSAEKLQISKKGRRIFFFLLRWLYREARIYRSFQGTRMSKSQQMTINYVALIRGLIYFVV